MRYLIPVILLVLTLQVLAQDNTPIPTSITETVEAIYTITSSPTMTSTVTPSATATVTLTPQPTQTPSPEASEIIATQPQITETLSSEITSEAITENVTIEMTQESTDTPIPSQVATENTPEVTEESIQATAESTVESTESVVQIIAESTAESTEDAASVDVSEDSQITAAATEAVIAETTAETTAEFTIETTYEITEPAMLFDATQTATPGGIPLRFVQGIAQYQNRPDQTGITISIFSIDNTLLSIDATRHDGIFSIPAPDNQAYWIVADAPLHLSTRIFVEPHTTLPIIVLPGGDLNDDACIDRLDLDQLTTAFERTDAPETDINGDGITDAADLAILTGNFAPGCETAINLDDESLLESGEMTEMPQAELTETVLEAQYTATPDEIAAETVPMEATAEVTQSPEQ